MNCATTMSASAAHLLVERTGVIAESVIDQFLRSLDNSTIANLHSGMSYTFSHDHDRSSHPRETGRTAAA
jgi:hypothetical protein